MAEDQPKFDPKLEEGIAYFEKMLKVMPEDRTTLEFLCVAYEQTGDEVKRRKALVSLAGLLIKEGDLEAASSIGDHLAKYREPDAQAMLLRIKAACRTAGAAEPTAIGTLPVAPESGPFAAPASKPTNPSRAAMSAETKLLQTLVAEKVLDEDTSALISQKLAELAALPGCFLISALALLEKENSQLCESAAAYVADASGAPPVPIESFDLSGEILQSLPESLMRVRGVLPFAKLADTLLVASLNPLDASLRREIESSAGHPCRHYIAHPRVMEETLDRLFAEAKETPTEPTPPAEGA